MRCGKRNREGRSSRRLPPALHPSNPKRPAATVPRQAMTRAKKLTAMIKATVLAAAAALAPHHRSSAAELLIKDGFLGARVQLGQSHADVMRSLSPQYEFKCLESPMPPQVVTCTFVGALQVHDASASSIALIFMPNSGLTSAEIEFAPQADLFARLNRLCVAWTGVPPIDRVPLDPRSRTQLWIGENESLRFVVLDEGRGGGKLRFARR